MAASPPLPTECPVPDLKYLILPSDLRYEIHKNVCHGQVSNDSCDFVESWCKRFNGITSEDVYSIAVKTAFNKSQSELIHLFKTQNKSIPRANFWRESFRLLCATQTQD
jgi:hypothetical protein